MVFEIPIRPRDNRTNLEAAVRYAHDEGMIKKKPKIEELFFPPSLQETKQYLG